tara:strand:- start:197 stop:607 length:411 start_codon:yes stop_codon:yes gene_type:complete
MFGSYLQGAIGLVVGIAGSITGFISLLYVLGGDSEALFWMVIGFVCALGGGYMRYLSIQTVRVGDSKIDTENSNADNSKDTPKFVGDRNLENDSYQLYLVKKYNIEKNNVLEKFTFNNKTYDSLEEALKSADILEK